MLDRVDFDHAKLADALKSLGDRGGINVVPLWDRMQTSDASPVSEITVHLNRVTWSVALTTVLDVASGKGGRCAWDEAGDIVTIADQNQIDRRHVVIRVYDVAAILDPNLGPLEDKTRMQHRATSEPSGVLSRTQAIDALRTLITTSIAPETWLDNGGDLGLVMNWGDKLVITTSERIHLQIGTLLERLGQSR